MDEWFPNFPIFYSGLRLLSVFASVPLAKFACVGGEGDLKNTQTRQIITAHVVCFFKLIFRLQFSSCIFGPFWLEALLRQTGKAPIQHFSKSEPKSPNTTTTPHPRRCGHMSNTACVRVRRVAPCHTRSSHCTRPPPPPFARQPSPPACLTPSAPRRLSPAAAESREVKRGCGGWSLGEARVVLMSRRMLRYL